MKPYGVETRVATPLSVISLAFAVLDLTDPFHHEELLLQLELSRILQPLSEPRQKRRYTETYQQMPSRQRQRSTSSTKARSRLKTGVSHSPMLCAPTSPTNFGSSSTARYFSA